VADLQEEVRLATEAAATADKRLQARKDELAAVRETAKALQAEVARLEEDRREGEVALMTTQMELRRVQLSQGRVDAAVRRVRPCPRTRGLGWD
jgi:chromosome segregation ATPase